MTRIASALGGRRGMPGCSAPSPACSTFAQGLLAGTGSVADAMLEAIRTVAERAPHLRLGARFAGWPGGDACSDETIGHTGFTGTGLWIDFERGLAWTLLTNRVHPTRHFDSGIFVLRPATGDAVITAWEA
jgi:CubicO group peptidase (beta-lactamase class C family)